MLNRVILMGRITHDLELRQTPSGVSSLTFTVAVDRNFTGQNGERQSDFIRCVAWRQTAEFISRYFAKGRMIAIEGNIRTGSYDDKNGVRHYTTDVYVDNASFTGEPRQQQNGGYQQGGYQQQGSYQNNNYQQNNPYQNNAPQQNSYNNAPADNNSLNIGELEDFEVLSDDGVPF